MARNPLAVLSEVIAGARSARAADLRAVAMDVVQITAAKDVPPGALLDLGPLEPTIALTVCSPIRVRIVFPTE